MFRKLLSLALYFLVMSLLLFTQYGYSVASPPTQSGEKDSRMPRPLALGNTAFLSNNLLSIYIAERGSNVWYYQYAPGRWGESNYYEHFAIYTQATGTVESENFTIVQPFTDPGGGAGTIEAILVISGVKVVRRVTMLPGDTRYFRIDYEITNISTATIQDVRFFEAIDFDVPWTGDHSDDYGWYDSVTDYIGVRDDEFFRNVVVSIPSSDKHSVDYWYTQIFDDWDDGDLSGNNIYGPGDSAVAKQFNLGNLVPQTSKSISFLIWFGDPSSTATCLSGQVTNSLGSPLSGVQITLINRDNNQAFGTQTQAQGNFTFENLAPGNYILRAQHNSYVPLAVNLTLGQGCYTYRFQLQARESFAIWNKAQAYAPNIYQDTDNSNYAADYITNFDYDGDWNGLNNWQNLFKPLNAYVYWNGLETSDHYYLEYYLFHPRDWGEMAVFQCLEANEDGDNRKECHENDMEGLVMAVNKMTGSIDGMVAYYHNQFLTLLISTCSPHLILGEPRHVFAEAKGHALRCVYLSETVNFPGGDGVIYRYTGTPEQPQNGNDRDVGYALLHVDDLRSRIGEANYVTTDTKKFMGNDYADNAATTPWSLEIELLGSAIAFPSRVVTRSSQPSQSSQYIGDLFADPARFFATVFPSLAISTDYIFNPYLNAVAQYQSDTGGWATSPLGDVAVHLPFGALGNTATVTVTYQVPIDISAVAAVEGSNFSLLGRPFALEVRLLDGSMPNSFNAPASIEVVFSSSTLRENNFDPSTLRLMKWQNSSWQPITTEVNVQSSKARAFINSPGVFGLFGRTFYKVYLPIVGR